MTILATIIVLGVLIFVHELGHFWAAKAVDIEVEKFSIGLGPRIWGFKRGETEYVISAIPLGGFVKMGGMGDEMMEKVEGGATNATRTAGLRDFDAKPVWARAIVISAGVIMNMLFALVVYVGSAAVWGARSADTTRLGDVAVEYLSPGTEALGDIPVGAHITEVGGEPVEDWGQIQQAVAEAEPGPLTVAFDQAPGQVEIQAPADPEARVRAAAALRWWTDPVLGVVNPSGPADRGGLQPGDHVVAVDGVEVATWDQFRAEIGARPGQTLRIDLERDGSPMSRTVTLDAVTDVDPATGEEREAGRVGVLVQEVPIKYSSVGLGDAVRIGWNRTVGTTGLILGFVRDLFTGGVSPRSLGSIITIGQASGQAASMGAEMFLSFMALFSVNLAVLNLLPIPILDGGHLVFLAVEAIRGKALSVEQRLRWSQLGLIVLLGIMVLALSNDILRLFGL